MNAYAVTAFMFLFTNKFCRPLEYMPIFQFPGCTTTNCGNVEGGEYLCKTSYVHKVDGNKVTLAA